MRNELLRGDHNVSITRLDQQVVVTRNDNHDRIVASQPEDTLPPEL